MLSLPRAALAARRRPRPLAALRVAMLGTLALIRMVLVIALMLLALSLLSLLSRRVGRRH